MSHQAVQAVLERTLEDESFRARLFTRPDETLAEYDLSDSERAALRSLCLEAEPSDGGGLDQRQSKAPLWTWGL